MRLAPGTRLDVYEILDLLGAGGMGEVYRARDSLLKREVAIKVLPVFVSQDPDRLRRFEQEAQAAAALNHPNILAVYQFGSFEGAPYLVSELLEGGTLRQQLERGPLAIRKAIDYGIQIAHGLAAAHEKGIIHRDLKPENLFVTKDGRVKILDFGLAKLMQRQAGARAVGPTQTVGTDPGSVMGTAGYMAPEQVRGQAIDHRVDIFAFGAILYEKLSGKRAFQRTTSVETMTAILNEEPQGISQVAQSTPPGLSRVVHRCLEKNPEQRFQSASDLAFALDALSESGSYSAPTAVKRPRVGRWTIAWMASALVVVALAAFGYLIGGRRKTVPFEHFSIQKAMDSERVMLTAISPDGTYLASVLIALNGDESLVVHHIPTGSERAVLQDPALKYQDVMFSPDGGYIYYRISALGTSAPNRDDVYRIPVLGGQPTRVIEDVDAPIRFINGGQTLCFYRQYVSEGIYKFLSVSVDGGKEQVLASAKTSKFPDSVACSPDGRRGVVPVPFTSDLEVLDFASGLKRPLISRAEKDGRFDDLEWEPDGKGIYAIEHKLPSWAGQVVFLSYPEGNLRQITDDLNDYEGISLTADTKTIATTQSNRDDRFASASLAEPFHLEEHGPEGLWYFTWLDNRRILASENTSGLKLVDLQTDETSTLNTAKDMSLIQPTVCGPDVLAVTGYRSGGDSSGIYRMQRDGSGMIQVTHGTQDVHASCTPDGRWLFYADYRSSGNYTFIMRQSLQGGIGQKIGKYSVYYSLSLDGKLLAVVGFSGGPFAQLKILSAETLKEVRSFSVPREVTVLAFSADNKRLFYAVQEGRQTEVGASTILWRQSLDAATPVKVANLPGKSVIWMRSSPDGTKLGLTTTNPQSEALLIRDAR